MAICEFFKRGNCKFGDRCKFEHPRSTRPQGQSYAVHQQNSRPSMMSTDSHNKAAVIQTTNPFAPHGLAPPECSESIFQEEVRKGAYPLTCCGNQISGDVSPEELRWYSGAVEPLIKAKEHLLGPLHQYRPRPEGVEAVGVDLNPFYPVFVSRVPIKVLPDEAL